MTQHEYIFIAISIVLGLAMTRLLHSAAGLVRAHKRVAFHWASALWAISVLIYILQLWWVGWELRNYSEWGITDFFVLVIGSIFIYGAADLALPTEDYDVTDDNELNFLAHSRSLGRVSALSMLGYFCVGPYVNITMFDHAKLPSIWIPSIGGVMMLLIMLRPDWFKSISVVFACYTIVILYLTA